MTNSERTAAALKAIKVHSAKGSDGPNEEVATHLGDLLTDLMHMSNELGLDFDERLESARNHFEAELCEATA